MDDPDFDDDDENVITDCPACGQTYDDADADFLICHHCGYDAEKKKYQGQKDEEPF
jgi:rRNA maturation endonuclease Nob1